MDVCIVDATIQTSMIKRCGRRLRTAHIVSAIVRVNIVYILRSRIA